MGTHDLLWYAFDQEDSEERNIYDPSDWEAFHAQHGKGHFFKERRYLMLEFPVLSTVNPAQYFIDIGSGCGSSTLPILKSNGTCSCTACDVSPTALQLLENGVKNSRDIDPARITTVVMDAAEDPAEHPCKLAGAEANCVLLVRKNTWTFLFYSRTSYTNNEILEEGYFWHLSDLLSQLSNKSQNQRDVYCADIHLISCSPSLDAECALECCWFSPNRWSYPLPRLWLLWHDSASIQTTAAERQILVPKKRWHIGLLLYNWIHIRTDAESWIQMYSVWVCVCHLDKPQEECRPEASICTRSVSKNVVMFFFFLFLYSFHSRYQQRKAHS